MDFEEQACQRLVGHLLQDRIPHVRLRHVPYGGCIPLHRWDFRSAADVSPTRPSGLRALSKAYIPRPRNNLRQRSPSRHARGLPCGRHPVPRPGGGRRRVSPGRLSAGTPNWVPGCCVLLFGLRDSPAFGFREEAAGFTAVSAPGGSFRVRTRARRVDAVARIFGRKAFARKDMPQVSAAAGTGDFGTPAVGIRRAPHGTGDFVVETRPAAPGVELVLRTVQRRTALAATVNPLSAMLVITARKRRFGTLCRRSHVFLPVSTASYPVFYGPGKRQANDQNQQSHTALPSNITPRPPRRAGICG